MQTESTGRISRQLTLDSAADHDSLDDDDVDSDEENGLRAEITSPPGNIATVSSERLVTHVINQYLLPPVAPHLKGKKCLVLDLDETLVHSSFREVDQPDYVVPVVLEGQEHNVYVVKRPGVDEFMRVMGEHYEIVVFTASLSMYADPVLDLLDKSKVVHHRLFRESCNLYGGNYVKDLSRLGRDVSQSIIIDNSPASYAFHPNNAIGISTWLNDMMDTELRDLIPFLIDLTKVEDVSAVLSITHNHAS
ncbi:NIF-domain-containing protein [Martensiomyces pterosporus]|nr:NIF-domain-containing protein [Martensiomyces pterosporus]